MEALRANASPFFQARGHRAFTFPSVYFLNFLVDKFAVGVFFIYFLINQSIWLGLCCDLKGFSDYSLIYALVPANLTSVYDILFQEIMSFMSHFGEFLC